MPPADPTTRPKPRRCGAPEASRAAAWLGRGTLAGGRFPGRRWVGAVLRRRVVPRGRPFGLRAADGVELSGWWEPAAEGVPRRVPILMLHGWLEVKEVHLPEAVRLSRLGHDVLLLDHRGHGRSGGRGVTFGVREREDAAAVLSAGERLGVAADRVVTMGFSLGAAVALQHAAADRRVAGVVAIAPFADFEAAIESFRGRLAPWLDPDWLRRGFVRAAWEAGFTLEQASTVEAVRALDRPVLLVEGDADRCLPSPQHTRVLAEAARGGSLELLTVPGATHLALCRGGLERVDGAVDAFCRRVAPTA